MKLINPEHLRYLVPAALIAAAAALGGSALADPATAGAVPEWDIGQYDGCVADWKGDKNDPGWDSHLIQCCFASGGIWSLSQGRCVAPPADAQQGPVGPLSPGGATHTLAPAPPPIRNPGEVTQTFTPASPG